MTKQLKDIFNMEEDELKKVSPLQKEKGIDEREIATIMDSPTDLSESEYVQVVSSQRLYDILKQLGREGEKKIDRDISTQIAMALNPKLKVIRIKNGSLLDSKTVQILEDIAEKNDYQIWLEEVSEEENINDGSFYIYEGELK